MIIVCEPQCKGVSHEKINSGFIYGLRFAYPNEKITFFSDASYFKNIKEILKIGKTRINNLSHFSISFNASKSFSIQGIFRYYFLFKKIFDKTLSFGENKIFFLSTSPIILFAIKKLKQQEKYKNICCTFVLHGELEDIANKEYKKPYLPSIPKTKNVLAELIKHPGIVLLLARHILSSPFELLSSNYSLIFKKIFRTKKMMMWRHSEQYHYISLSPHVTKNANKYLNTKYLNFNTVIMPIIFSNPLPKPKNKYIKFAVFGYGDSGQMYKMLTKLSKKKISKPFEIKIISMDGRGTEEFQNIKHVGQGRVLTRKEMEKAAQDIDVFINLYTKNYHSLGCSLSIFEALSYLKPILHLSNPGYNYFNKPEKPIGYRCKNLDDFVDKMYDMIQNFSRHEKQLTIFRKNMLGYRKEYNIKNNLLKLKKSFTFEE
ncbi:MAG: hypothetical protein A2182_03135 [Candidatus Pacebacteria bacterium RIFOXYA1_FULL_38_18]|nr:MAG: hypothetical protein A2182_03135 [Candidatus Pacebacteria bacterium RIFOXYA1_FULL_38_18]OGJ39466.1 MAG: hypothetical protein A2411_01775 [Candidatus Pacebacteria bacterium RIFOXYC1_FULL_39_21]